ncbi:hypothetical protein NCC49_006176 [Naganishia albida]|nr:hypothetical protein NCC49_006176 [Naganishia albida]
MDPDEFNMDIPILARAQPVRTTPDRDACDMDIPNLFRRLFHLKLSTTSRVKASGEPYPPTPVYWSEAMERESECEKRSTALEEGWVVIMERGKFVGRVDVDETTA